MGPLITFNYDHPASKVVGTGVFIVIGSTLDGPLSVELIEPNPDFPAFQRCPRLAGWYTTALLRWLNRFRQR